MVHATTLLLSVHVAASKNVSASSNLSVIRAMQPYIRRLGRERNGVNRPFYSCLFCYLAFKWQWGWRWPCFDLHLTAFVVHVNQVVLMLTSRHLNEKRREACIKQGHLQPRLHSEARYLRKELQSSKVACGSRAARQNMQCWTNRVSSRLATWNAFPIVSYSWLSRLTYHQGTFIIHLPWNMFLSDCYSLLETFLCLKRERERKTR